MKHTTSLEERMQIWTLAQAGHSHKGIAALVGWTVPTVRKWLRCTRRAGRAGLVSPMGRPRAGSLSSFTAELQQVIETRRNAHPGHGALSLLSELAADPAWQAVALPSRASVARFLAEKELVRPYERHSTLPDIAPATATAPHELWEMDARGHTYVPAVGVITLVNLNDRYSHLRLLSYPLQVGQQRWQRHPMTADYQLALRLAFCDWGLPQQLQVDHESVYFDNHSPSPFPTRWHLWLLALGVSVRFGRSYRATDQALTERSHQLWAAQVLEGQTFADWQTLYQALQHRRTFLNQTLPCASLNHLPPLQAFPEARHSGRLYRPEYEAELLDLQRVWDYLAQGRWFRLVSKDGTFSLGGHVYYVGYTWAHQQLELTFDATGQQLHCHNAAGDLIASKPIQALTKEDLMGDLTPALSLPFFQLTLPFDPHNLQVLRLCETLVL